MRQFSIKNILIISFLTTTFTAVAVILIQRYHWVESYEKERIHKEYIPIVESLGKIIINALNTRIQLLESSSEEILKAGNNGEAVQRLIDSIRHRNPAFKTVWVGDSRGKAIIFSPLYGTEGRPNAGRDYSNREYFHNVRDLRKPVVGDILMGRAVGEPIVPLVVPLIKNGGEFSGFLFAAYGTDFIRDAARSYSVPGRGNLIITDRRGMMIAASKNNAGEKVMTDLSGTGIFQESLQSLHGVAEYLSAFDGRRKIGAFYGMENGWKIWLSKDSAEMEEEILSSFAYSLFWGVMAAAASIAVSYVLSRYLSGPIISLKTRTKLFAAKNFSFLDEGRRDIGIIHEINDLNGSFIAMAGELREMWDGLEKKIHERTLELEAANRAKSDFLASMSHELRTPLNSIIGFSDVLIDRLFGDLNGKQLEYVNDINTSGRHLLGLINDILDLSKVESGKMDMELDRFPLRAVLEASITMLKEKAMKKGVALGIVVSPDADIKVAADKRKLKQIMFNLVGNAVKFTPKGGGGARLSAFD